MRGQTPSCILILSACPATEVSDNIARALVENKLAACVNIIAGIVSHFRWQGEINKEQERLLLIKTTRDHYHEVEKLIRSMHPYELPEIIAVPVAEGLESYLDWIIRETT